MSNLITVSVLLKDSVLCKDFSCHSNDTIICLNGETSPSIATLLTVQ